MSKKQSPVSEFLSGLGFFPDKDAPEPVEGHEEPEEVIEPEEEEEPEEVDDPAPEPEPEEEPEDVDEHYRQRLMESVSSGQPKPAVPNVPEPPEPEPAKQHPPTDAALIQLTPEQHKELMSDPAKFAEFMNNYGNSIREQSMREATQVATSNASQQIKVMQAVSDFYRKNEDLAPYKKYIGSVANRVQSEHPDWELDQVLNETEKRSRTDLRLAQKAQETESKRKKNPGFAPPPRGADRRGGQKTNETLTPQQKQINELIASTEL